MWPNTFTEKTLNGKLHLLCSVAATRKNSYSGNPPDKMRWENPTLVKLQAVQPEQANFTLNKVFTIRAFAFSLINVTRIIFLRVAGRGWSDKLNESIYTSLFNKERQKIPSLVTDACSFTAAFILYGTNALVNNWKLKRRL